jgi:hypothetical protein
MAPAAVKVASVPSSGATVWDADRVVVITDHYAPGPAGIVDHGHIDSASDDIAGVDPVQTRGAGDDFLRQCLR